MGKGTQHIDWIGLAVLIPPPLFWAGNFIVGRAVRDDIPPLTLLFWRWVIALLVLLPFAWRSVKRDYGRYKEHAGRILAVSLAGIVAFNAFVYFGLQATTASNALLLNSFIPILIVLFGALFYGQQMRGSQALGLLVSVAGVLTIVLQGDWTRLAALSFSRGDLLVCSAMVSWAFYTLWLRGIPGDVDRIGLMAVQIFVGVLVLLPLYIWGLASGSVATWNTSTITALAYLGIFPSVIAYLLYNIGVSRVGAARAGLSIHLLPIFGVVLAVLFLRESLHTFHAVGVATIAAGILLCTTRLAKPSSAIPAKK